MNDIIFRKAEPKDLEDVSRLVFELLKLEDKKYDPTINVDWPYRSGKDFFRKEIINKNSFIEVVEIDGKIIGLLYGSLSQCPPYRQKAIYAEIYHTFVKEEYRGRKTGQRLIRDFFDWCREKKVDYVALDTSINNKPAISFYKKMGFKEYALVLEIKLSKK